MEYLERLIPGLRSTEQPVKELLTDFPVATKVLGSVLEQTADVRDGQQVTEEINAKLFAVLARGADMTTGRALLAAFTTARRRNRDEILSEHLISAREQNYDLIDQFIDVPVLQQFVDVLLSSQARNVTGLLQTYMREAYRGRTDANMIMRFFDDQKESDDEVVSFTTERDSSLLSMHMAYVSDNPLTQMRSFADDIVAIRNGKKVDIGKQKGANRPVDLRNISHIQGISWVVRPGFDIVLRRAGITPEKGLSMRFYDVNKLVDDLTTTGQPSDSSLDETTTAKVLRCSLENILFVPGAIRSFLHDGSLPPVGKITFPSKLMFTKTPQRIAEIWADTKHFKNPDIGDDYE